MITSTDYNGSNVVMKKHFFEKWCDRFQLF
jgi:hypothetical protein